MKEPSEEYALVETTAPVAPFNITINPTALELCAISSAPSELNYIPAIVAPTLAENALAQ